MSTPDLLANYLSLQPRIEQRLREQLGNNIPVEGIEELGQAGMEDRRPQVVFVYWAGDRFDESDTGRAGRGASQILRQRWLVLIYVRNDSQLNRDARNQAAGALLSSVHKALAGWQPDGVARTFTRANGPAPDYTRASGMLPLGFEITLTL